MHQPAVRRVAAARRERRDELLAALREPQLLQPRPGLQVQVPHHPEPVRPRPRESARPPPGPPRRPADHVRSWRRSAPPVRGVLYAPGTSPAPPDGRMAMDPDGCRCCTFNSASEPHAADPGGYRGDYTVEP